MNCNCHKSSDHVTVDEQVHQSGYSVDFDGGKRSSMFQRPTKAFNNSASKPRHQTSPHSTPPLPSQQGTSGSWKGFLKDPTSAFIIIMILLAASVFIFGLNLVSSGVDGASGEKSKPGAHEAGNQEALGSEIDLRRYKLACPDYRHYAVIPHRPFSDGPLSLPYQRPSPHCRTFSSSVVEKVIEDVTSKMEDKDLARIFENAFPNTLDTTVRWHVDGSAKKSKQKHGYTEGQWEGAQSFIVTGDINAEWLRDSTNQLAQYQVLAKKDKKLEKLILGAINTQAEFIIESPYCNAFQPPPPSQEPAVNNGQADDVHPVYEPSRVFECKYELDSLAHFLRLGTQFHKNTGSKAFLTARWYIALKTVLEVLQQQAKPTFNSSTGKFERNEYSFRRKTNIGTETLNLGGIGNPLSNGTGLIRSAFRPSDDATILGFLIPANAMMAVELKRTAEILKSAKKDDLAKTLQQRAESIEKGIWEHGVIKHKIYGDVFAYEVDGYGSTVVMDDANVPSLLALPLLGFVAVDDKTYQNTRKMILEKAGNPYYLNGRGFAGIGGPHIGLQYAWPISRLIQAMTSSDDDEIIDALQAVRDSSRLGLVHESINVDRVVDFTRSWFAWANSVFAQTILHVAEKKPHLIFGKGIGPYVIE